MDIYFKTSYVTVYQETGLFSVSISKFQNIVCYCLSKKMSKHSGTHSSISKHRMLLFIRSSACVPLRTSVISKHRMLLFIFLSSIFSKIIHFISKHRMLLFISSTGCSSYDNVEFQNIVCYCLSRYSFVVYSSSSYISKHRMLLFIE